MEEVTSVFRFAKEAVSNPERPRLTRTRIEQDPMGARELLMADYFDDDPVYKDPKVLRRHFRMSKRLFLH